MQGGCLMCEQWASTVRREVDRPAANKGMSLSSSVCVMVSIGDIAHEEGSCTFSSSYVVTEGPDLLLRGFFFFFLKPVIAAHAFY